MVHKLEARFDRSETGGDFLELFNQASGKVGRLKRMRPEHAEGLRARLNAMRAVANMTSNAAEGTHRPVDAFAASSDPPF